MASLRISNVNMPEPDEEGLEIGEEPIWSASTGRSTGAKMIGDIIGYKTTLRYSKTGATLDEINTIETALKSTVFKPVAYKDTKTKKPVTIVCYNGPWSKKVVSYNPERYDIVVELIEQ